MEMDIKKTLRGACRQILRPIVSMLLKCGMTWKEFADLSKSVYVQVATDEFGIKGRPTNVSRASILTGVSRKEVKHQRDILANEEPVMREKTTDATRVLSGWHQDPLYLDSESRPRLLPENGPAPSFETLCDSYGGDIAVTTMLKELLKTKAVELTGDGRYRVVRRYYQPAVHDDETLRWAASLIRDLTETANNDVFLDDARVRRFCRKADNERIPLSAIPDFNSFLEQRGQAFLEEIDDWLTEHVAGDITAASDCARIGVGLFAIENRKHQENQR